MVEVTGHLCRQMQVPWNSKGFCHSEAVFSLKFNTMSRIDVRLFGERRTFQEAIVTIVSSKDPTRWPYLIFVNDDVPLSLFLNLFDFEVLIR